MNPYSKIEAQKPKMKEDEINFIVMQVYSSFGRAATELTHEFFNKALDGFSIAEIKEAFIEHAKESSHCPKPADIRNIIRERRSAVATDKSVKRREEVEAMPSAYDRAYSEALRQGNWEEMKRLRDLVAAEFVSRLQNFGVAA